MLLCPWNSPGKSTGVDCHFLVQGIFPTQGSNLGLLHCRRIPYCLSHQGSPCFFIGRGENLLHRPAGWFSSLSSWALGRNHSICRVKWGEITSGTICPYRLYLFAIHQLLLSFTSVCNVNDHFSLKLHNDAQLKKVIESAKREQMEVFSPICIFIKK